jgi:peptidyl-prolyl cis-trans isomerase SurA
MTDRAPIRLRFIFSYARGWTFVAAGCPILAATLFLPLGWDRMHSPRGKFIKSTLISTLFCCLAATVLLPAQQQVASPVVLDSVVAVVNRHPILASDIDEEMRLSVLDPTRTGQGAPTRHRALELLISRTLIQEQIHRDEVQATELTADDVNARLLEIRKELPACVHENCSTEAGWNAFLAAHDLTPEQVDAYFRNRLEILRFIEQRFRPGIHISPQDIEDYYRNTLLPQYKPGETVPPLEQVSPRIEEILLQQHVNVLFDEWLTNLRKQGDVEVLDPTLEAAQIQGGVDDGSKDGKEKGVNERARN